MRIGLVVFANKYTGAGAVAEACCRSLRTANVDARLVFVAGRNLERRLESQDWATPCLVKERTPVDIVDNLACLRRLASEMDAVICHLPHDHMLCMASGVHRRTTLVRAFRNPRHLEHDAFSRLLGRSVHAGLLAYAGLDRDFQQLRPGRPSRVLPVPIPDAFVPSTEAARWRERFGVPADGLVVGMVGKLAPGRGFGTLLETASRIRQPVHVLAVGHGEALPELRRRAADLGISHCVHWAGYRDTDLPNLYSVMDVVLFLAPGSDWGHRMVSEAQGCGRTVVAAAIPGVDDLIDDRITGRITTADVDALAATVSEVLADRPGREQIASAAAAAAAARRFAPAGLRLAEFLAKHASDSRGTTASPGTT